MLNIFKKPYELVAPVSGKLLQLAQVPDPVFAQKMAGDGIAIEAEGDIVLAPADGKLSFIFRTNHAFGMVLGNGLEILVHVGMDTVTLNGEGFERLAEEGVTLRAGDPVLKIQRKTLTEKGMSFVTPVVISNADKVAEMRPGDRPVVEAGRDVVLRYRLK
ncbi:Phosphotransferase system, sugar-specific permease EIIA type 1 [Acididesulfobacillus acetoxydans]|uniref:Glucose-specific phosphotransferase enzyme IIA component n=1 Tax=Acididesulfobacillus acetoxydans TaxID=1561005 RepID=A0A8S0WZY5_9FIRM|nr:PTS glucose transporter subunit IIA [Acididesulfobacillus acetoxydans]CAA7602241.1 Phosphotransferase system, sugar-specific permease EIIA type 1 [Acididesulfobacillus acetoxydans]CEJ07541.1 Glucose-specific phosphotransferase enzyme IIA component [Acididesulfobacillus acetoxydans]